jgi:hypothetical protein
VETVDGAPFMALEDVSLVPAARVKEALGGARCTCERGGFRTVDGVTLQTVSLVAPNTAALEQGAEPPASRAALLHLLHVRPPL